ncbi:MAG: MarR family transcriptional regulator [Methanomicrobiales archaeon]|nr:MarR family transcriptional regulator [Methanomicrobiales archaeon]
MREEDLDWVVYHCIPENGGVTTGDLAAATGLEPGEVTVSLERLERYLLIRRSGKTVRLMSVQESLIECQCRYTSDLPFIIENGIIKARRREE